MKKNYAKRFLTLSLIVMMVLSLGLVSAYAQDITDTTVQEETETTVPAVETADPLNITTAAQLEAAIASDAEEICITASFEIDRTFYITRDVTVYSTEAVTLTRAADFAGDIFVIGEAADGTVCSEPVTLSVGTAGTTSSDMLTINGNKENMTVDVTGSVFFVCKNGQADLYPDLTVTNCEKKGNDRALDKARYTLCSDRTIIGGAVAVIVEAHSDDPSSIKDGVMNIYGGKYTYNSGTAAGLYGGAFFNHSKLYVYDGVFEHNDAVRAGAFYNYRRMSIYKANISNNQATKIGGAIYLPKSTGAILYVDGGEKTENAKVVFRNNSSVTGGAISSSGTLVLRNALFEGNTATSSAGAVYCTGVYNNTWVYHSVFDGNEAAKNGGVFCINEAGNNADADLYITDSVFTENKASENGGVAYLTGSSRAYVKNSEFTQNSSTVSGGVAYLTDSSRAYVKNSEFTQNSSKTGGVADLESADAEFDDVTFTQNSASDDGGVFNVVGTSEKVTQEDETEVTVYYPAKLTLNKVTATGNSAVSQGGIAYSNIATVNIYESEFKQNSAYAGGACYFYKVTDGGIYNTVVEENICSESNDGNAGALLFYTDTAKMTVQDCTLRNNSTSGFGGAILVSGKTMLDLYNITATGNSALKGGFMYETAAGTVVTASGITVSGNSATVGGPIIWGNTENAKLYINKNNYTDSDVETPLGDAYWTTAIVNKLTVYDSKASLGVGEYEKPDFSEDNFAIKGHTYTSVATATCTEGGDTTYTCPCGDTYKVFVEALGHKEISHKAKDPTCTEIGWDEYVTCSRCDYTTYAEKTSLGHDEIAHDAKDPTCTEIGWDAYVTCSRCDYTTRGEDIPSLGGHEEVAHEAKTPTCTEIGWDAYVTCSRCDYTTYEEKTSLGHDEIAHDAKDPTCTEIGWDAYVTCSRCDYTTRGEDIPSLGGHEEVAHEAKTPTCTEIGWDAYVTCSRCDYTTYAEKTSLGHDKEYHDAQAPTCTEIGWDEYVTCTRCDYTTYIEKPSHGGHDKVIHEAKTPTCTEIGWDEYESCLRCDYTTYEEKPALNHDEIAHKAQAPTCTEIGWDAYVTCSRCDYTTRGEDIPALDHDKIAHEAKAPTCTAIGWEAYETCSRCNYTTYDEKQELGHDEIPNEAKAPTCTAIGWDAYITCSRCSYSTYEEKAALGHTGGTANCKDKAVCTECGEAYGSVNAKNHKSLTTLGAKAATCTGTGLTEGKKCTACGTVTVAQNTVAAKGHTLTTLKAVAPTCTASGKTEGKKCTTCGTVTVEQKTVAAKGHTLTTLKAVAATCTKEGKTEGKKCTACGVTTIAQKAVAKKAHSYKTVTTKATLTKNGKVENKCSVCGNVSKTTTVYYPKTIKLSKTAYTYNGKTQTPTVTVKDSKGNTLKKDTDYTVKYASGRKNTGKYSVTITFKGKYSGTKKLYFNILPSKTSKITPDNTTTSIKASWKKVTGADGYKVELLSSKGKVLKTATTTKLTYTFKKLSKVTTYKVRVTAYKTIDKKKVYATSSVTLTTSTAPAKVTLSKVTASSKAATPAWKSVSGASGYEVMYSTSSKFKSSKTSDVKKGSTVKTTIKKLTKGKTYYFQVRAYKIVDGKKVYGDWSAVKSVKVK